MIVDVYYNRTRKCWSLRHKNRVIDHVPRLALVDCTMRTSEASRQQVIRTGKRGVHAWVRGTLVKDLPAVCDAQEIGYSPFRAGGFAAKSSGLPVVAADVVLFEPDGRCFVASSRLVSGSRKPRQRESAPPPAAAYQRVRGRYFGEA